MNCFYHPDVPALGLCKSCYRGLCSDCAVATPAGVACVSRCEEDVRAMQELIQFNMSVQRTARRNLTSTRNAWVAGGIFVALFGLFFAGIGLAATKTSFWLIAFGGLIGIYGCFMVVRALRFNLPPKPSESRDSRES